ncbi:MAG TPA: DUF4245 family protein [Kineosporiaceae bacterium]|nr:DUF4245 family protein [Kineosporiaceae bacterium]
MGGLAVLVAVLTLLVPRANSVPLETIDASAAARAAAAQLGFTPAVPVGLPGWTVTIAGLRQGSDGILTWHLGLRTAAGNYAGVEQASTSSAAWVNTLSSGAGWTGFEDVAGHRWQYLVKAERSTTTLVLREPGRTTLVTAKSGGLADAERLIEALPPDTLTLRS